jgi:hypothetical protein
MIMRMGIGTPNSQRRGRELLPERAELFYFHNGE